MREKIDLFLPCEYIDDAQNALSVLHEYKTVQHIHFLVSADFAAHHQVPEGCTFVITDRLESSNTIASIAENVTKLRELSPLWEMHQDGIDLNSIKWAAH